MTDQGGWGWYLVKSIPRRVANRIVRDLRLDWLDTKQKASETVPIAFTLVVAKWLGFWTAVIGSAFTIGLAGMMLISLAEWAASVRSLASTASWLIQHVWLLGFMVVLIWGVLMFAILVVSILRLLLWIRRALAEFWKQYTPRFTNPETPGGSLPWPPSSHELETAWGRMVDFFVGSAALFVAILTILLFAELESPDALIATISSPYASLNRKTASGSGRSLTVSRRQRRIFEARRCSSRLSRRLLKSQNYGI